MLLLFPFESIHTRTTTLEEIGFLQKAIQRGITTDSQRGFAYDTHILSGLMAS